MMENNRRAATLLCTWVHFLIGGVYAAFQVLIPRMIVALGGSTLAVSLLVASLFLGSVLTSLISGEISERFGSRVTMIVSCLALVTGCVLVIVSGSIWTAIVGLLMSGFGIGGNEGAGMSIIEIANPGDSDRKLCYAMALYGLGGFLIPIFVERCFAPGSYRPVMMIMAVLFGITAFQVFRQKMIDSFAAERGEEKKGLSVSIIWNNKILALSILAQAIYCGLESGLTYYATEVFGSFGSVSAGSYAVSAYWLAIMIGSFTGGLMKNALRYLSGLLIAGGIGTLAVLFIPSLSVKVGLMFVIGLLFGPAYGLIAYLGGHSAPENTGMAYAAMAFGASIGGAAFQPLAAAVLAAFPVRAAYILVFFMCILDSILIRKIREL